MRLIQAETKFRNRFFVDGKPVTEEVFDQLLDSELRFHPKPSMSAKSEITHYGCRIVWDLES